MLQTTVRRASVALSSRRWVPTLFAAMTASTLLLAGCARQQPVTMAPPVAPMNNSPMTMGGNGGAPAAGGNVYNWQDVPVGQQVPVNNAVFDQGGYQIYATSGETIVIPFTNQNLYVLKFGQTSSGMYFINDGTAPTLFLPPGGSLANAAASGARWYPFAQNYNYERPVYIGIAPSWADYTGMGWYPGMSYYGGYWGYRPGLSFSPMAGLYVNIGGHPYYGWGGYHNYYYSNPVNRVYVSNAPRYNYSSAGRRSPSSTSFGSTRSTGSFGRNSGSGSFGSSRTGSSFGSSRNSTGSFGSGGSRSTFGSTPRSSSGSFGGGTSSFGGSTRRSSGSFGSGSSGYGGSFGGRSGSFGSGSSSGSRSSFGGGSFGGSRSSGSSFGGSRSSFGGGRRR